MIQDTGGPAFPYGREWNRDRSEISRWEENGMTMLDYFAGLAMQAFLHHISPSNSLCGDGALARTAYTVAEAMIAEKRRRESNV